MMGGASIGGDN
jgi:phosphoribosylformylglycinamidine synthase PurS subunit